MPTRRQFIKTGLIGGALLASAYALRRPLDRLGKQALVAGFPLPEALREVIAAVAPVMLAGMIPAQGEARAVAVERSVQAVAAAVSRLSASSQREVAELFALLTLPPARVALAGIRRSWSKAGEDEVRVFLDSWRHSSLDLLKTGYLALHDLVLGAWYADSATWAAIGYPGPPYIPK